MEAELFLIIILGMALTFLAVVSGLYVGLEKKKFAVLGPPPKKIKIFKQKSIAAKLPPEPKPQQEPPKPAEETKPQQAPQPQTQTFPYVTIEGKEPEEPKSFFHTKKFIASTTILAIILGAISYFMFFAR